MGGASGERQDLDDLPRNSKARATEESGSVEVSIRAELLVWWSRPPESKRNPCGTPDELCDHWSDWTNLWTIFETDLTGSPNGGRLTENNTDRGMV